LFRSSDVLLPEQSHRLSSAEAASLYIRRLIMGGHLPAGERVPQDDIARALKISRIPIREAIVALEQQGWVTVEKNRGAYAAVFDERAVRDHYELYGLVFGFAAQKALERADSLLGEDLKLIARDFANAQTPEAANPLSLAFHANIIRAADSPRISGLLRAAATLLPGNFYTSVPAAMELQRPGFTAIARALTRGDGERAAAEYAKMMRRVANEVVVLFRDRGLFV
jgi:DNA-binding GntR family transcriptional regulator